MGRLVIAVAWCPGREGVSDILCDMSSGTVLLCGMSSGTVLRGAGSWI